MMKKYLASVTVFCCCLAISAQTIPYKDSTLSFHERAKDLVSRMTLEEKINQVGHSTMAISRLGVKGYNYWNEGLHGVARSGAATSFPSSKAMSSTWDMSLIKKCAEATANEARWYNRHKNKGLVYWCPTINMSRDPRWGRDEENYGEDPYLTGRIAVEYIKGMQGDDPKYYKTVATAKHFAANNYEGGRHDSSSDMDERDLREYYLPAFEMAVKEGNVRSIMSAYNALNGIPCCANHELLIDILRTEWGFDGFVTSDCGAIDDIFQKHRYAATGAEASAVAMVNGEDLNCGNTFQDHCREAIEKGYMTEAQLDTALVRVFEARFSLGEFDSNHPYVNCGEGMLECSEHRALALQASHEAIVLLKNEGNCLPLHASDIQKIAVIGPYSNTIQLGGYTGEPTYKKTLLQAVADVMNFTITSDGTIQAENYDEATKGRVDNPGIGFIESGAVFRYDNVDFGEGKTKFSFSYAGCYGNRQMTVRIDNAKTGTLLYQGTLPATANNWTTFVTVVADLPEEAQTIIGTHTVYLSFSKLPEASDNNRYIVNVDWFRVYNEDDVSSTALGSRVMCAQGSSVSGSTDQKLLDEAVSMAKEADVVLLALGTDLNVSDESRDRNSLSLPVVQQKLLESIYAVNPNVVLILSTCSSMDISWADRNVPAIIEAWYDGQEQGQAICDVVFGSYNPGGKLTSTWYASLSNLPSNLKQYGIRKNKYTYMYHDRKPLYPFGHGLSYTSFAYSDLALDRRSLNPGEEIKVTANIINTGLRDGAEVVQLYVHCQSEIERPIKQLVGFVRVELKAGETKQVAIPLKHEQLAYYNDKTFTFDVETGDVDIYLAASSADVRLQDKISVMGSTVKSTYKSSSNGMSLLLHHKPTANKVYNLSGVCMGDTDSFNTLSRGLYIVDGNKCIIKDK